MASSSSSSFLQKIGRIWGSAQVTGASPSARSVAKDRLSVILASQRGSELLEGVDMELLQRDVFQVVQKHITVAKNKPVQFQINSDGEVNLFEMSVELEAGGRSPAGPTNVTIQTARS